MTSYLGTTTYSYDSADRLTASTGPGATSYTYDANGNELTAGSATYTYDLANRIVSATIGATTQTYTWSGDVQPSGPAPPPSPGSPGDCAP